VSKRSGLPNDTVVEEFFSLVNARVPIKCHLCHEPIETLNGVLITPHGVYHGGCYYEAELKKLQERDSLKPNREEVCHE